MTFLHNRTWYENVFPINVRKPIVETLSILAVWQECKALIIKCRNVVFICAPVYQQVHCTVHIVLHSQHKPIQDKSMTYKKKWLDHQGQVWQVIWQLLDYATNSFNTRADHFNAPHIWAACPNSENFYFRNQPLWQVTTTWLRNLGTPIF